MKKYKFIGHVLIAISGMFTVWLANAFITANINPFTYSVDGRTGMLVAYVVGQIIGQLIYCANVYKL